MQDFGLKILSLLVLVVIRSVYPIEVTSFDQLSRHKFQELLPSTSVPTNRQVHPLDSVHQKSDGQKTNLFVETNRHTLRVMPLGENQNSYLSGSDNNELRATSHQRSSVLHQSSNGPSELLAPKAINDLPTDQGPANQGGFLLPANLELALRQASGDESVFQPSPTIGAPNLDHFDWHASSESKLSAKEVFKPTQKYHNQLINRTIVTSSTTSATSTTSAPMLKSTLDLNNHLHNNNVPEPILLLHHQSILSHQKEYPTNANSSSMEFNNQVIYEGPATAPSSVNSDDYYFSASEKMKDKELTSNENNEHPTSNAWWALGIGAELERINNLTRDNYLDYCDKSVLLMNGKQRSLCRMHPRVMPIVARGLKMAIEECQAKFASSRWNCSIVVHESFVNRSTDEDTSLSSHQSIFGDVMKRPNRERSFLNAIIAAGLAHSMTKACSQGELPEECSCDRKIKSKNNKGRIEWVACSDDIDYGARFSRDFTDNFDPVESDTTSTIYLHNSEVGRRVFKSATDITCTCLNNDNGLCQTKRCWKHLGPFSDIVDELIKRYEGATHVQRSNKDPHKLRPVRRGVRRPKRKDLVYIEESPDYCQEDTRIGVLGTQNRVCNSTSQGPDSCSLLCCGRGFQTIAEHIEEDCNCKFVWCCQVKCDRCKRYLTNDVCN